MTAQVEAPGGEAPNSAPDAPAQQTGTETPIPDAAQERALDFVHASALQHVVMADRKAGIVFTLLSAALLFLFTRMPVFAWPPDAEAALWLVTVALLVSATALAFLVVLPRVRGATTPGVLFWGAIARHRNSAAFVEALCANEASQLGRGKAAYCYELSRICQRKFQLLQLALVMAAAGLMLFLVLLAVAGGGANGPVPQTVPAPA